MLTLPLEEIDAGVSQLYVDGNEQTYEATITETEEDDLSLVEDQSIFEIESKITAHV